MTVHDAARALYGSILFNQVSLRGLRQCFEADRDAASAAGDANSVAFCETRIQLIDEELARRAASQSD